MNSTTEIIDAFRAAMREAGIEPPDSIRADGKLHRFHIAGHKHGSLNGAYKLHLDGIKPAGYFEDFKAGIKTNWKADGQAKPLTQAERQQMEARKRQSAQHCKPNSNKPPTGLLSYGNKPKKLKAATTLICSENR